LSEKINFEKEDSLASNHWQGQLYYRSSSNSKNKKQANKQNVYTTER
jgi:hypothetical protein